MIATIDGLVQSWKNSVGGWTDLVGWSREEMSPCVLDYRCGGRG